jgi:hypothetical protein
MVVQMMWRQDAAQRNACARAGQHDDEDGDGDCFGGQI